VLSLALALLCCAQGWGLAHRIVHLPALGGAGHAALHSAAGHPSAAHHAAHGAEDVAADVAAGSAADGDGHSAAHDATGHAPGSAECRLLDQTCHEHALYSALPALAIAMATDAAPALHRQAQRARSAPSAYQARAPPALPLA